MLELQDLCLLVVEDDYLQATALKSMLAYHGAAEVHLCADAESALHLIASRPLDAAVLDVNLPGERDVFSVVDALRARSCAVVLATGYDEARIPPSYAGTARLRKPIAPADLIGALTRSISDVRTV